MINLIYLFREKRDAPIPPLKNLQFYVLNNNEEVKKRILRLGGLVLSKGNVINTTAAVIAKKKDLEKMQTRAVLAHSMIVDSNIEVCNHNNDVDSSKGKLPTFFPLWRPLSLAQSQC